MYIFSKILYISFINCKKAIVYIFFLNFDKFISYGMITSAKYSCEQFILFVGVTVGAQLILLYSFYYDLNRTLGSSIRELFVYYLLSGGISWQINLHVLRLKKVFTFNSTPNFLYDKFKARN